MKLKKGMYIRTEDGRICKILKLNEPFEDDGYLDHNDIGSASIQEKNVIKASFNLIDLIEVGDYVNGYLVIEKPYKYYDTQFISLDTTESWGWGKGKMPAKYIETIITKEQFNSCKYVVERDNQ